MALLESADGPAHEVVNASGKSSAFLVCDHASNRIPRALGDLGLDDNDRLSHIGWDIGAANVARRMSELLDAPLVLSGFSRLVIDCNRPFDSPTSIPEESGGVVVPANRGLPEEVRRERREACFWPYHRAIAALLEERQKSGLPTVLLAIHSFTPELLGQKRPWHTGILYGKDARLAGPWLREMWREESLVVGDNEPYRVTDGGDYTLPNHAEARSIPGILIEIRQDLIEQSVEVEAWAQRLSKVQEIVGVPA